MKRLLLKGLQWLSVAIVSFVVGFFVSDIYKNPCEFKKNAISKVFKKVSVKPGSPRIYAFRDVMEDWGSANNFAKTWGGHLVSLGNVDDDRWLRDTFYNKPNGNYYFLGAHKCEDDNELKTFGKTDDVKNCWRWANGDIFSYGRYFELGLIDGNDKTNWPKDSVFVFDEKWRVVRHNEPHYSVVEWKSCDDIPWLMAIKAVFFGTNIVK